MADGRDGSRLRQRLNPLLTSLGGFSQHSNTPVSAVPYSATSYIASTPASAIQPYNPQQWIPSPMPAQGSQLPPPPYSPPRGPRPTSMSFEGSHLANMSVARAPLAAVHRPSPEPTTNQSFPPPPNARGSSRERRFGFPSLGRRREPDAIASPQSLTPSHQPSFTPSPSRPHGLSIHIPQTPSPMPSQNPSSPSAPPSARRAVSTGAIDTPTSARSRSASQSRWNQQAQVPPPPPGPPPPHSRSQSASRTFPASSEPVLSPPTRRPPPSGVAALGPVPPTPANWVDNDESGRQQVHSTNEPSHQVVPNFDHQVVIRASDTQVPTSSTGSPPAGLNRTNATRADKTLRQRRNESRTRDPDLSTEASIAALEDIVIPATSGDMSRARTGGRKTSRTREQAQNTPGSGDLSSEAEEDEGSRSTPRATDTSGRTLSNTEIPTPPFSPRPAKTPVSGEASSFVAPKALPTPPPRSRSVSRSIPTAVHGAATPLSSKSLAPVTKESLMRQNAEQFCQHTVERFRAFAQREAAATEETEKVRLFAEFIVSESRIRRERYSSAIGAMGSEIFDLTRDLFRPMTSRRESTASQASDFTPQSSEPTRSHRGSIGSEHQGEAFDVVEAGAAPVAVNAVSISPSGSATGGNYNSTFRPSLSPILSMSVSSRHDDDSRGRPASRWWESTSSGDGTKWERSKRESKYMSVPKEAREALQWTDDPLEGSSRGDSSTEYPPEKQGWHESPIEQSYRQTFSTQLTPYQSQQPPSLPNTPDPKYLDVSRLVTLPPPYPRHHPAVNNNHPELTDIRATVRTLADLSEVDATKTRFNHDSQVMYDEAEEAAKKRRLALGQNLHQEISLGRMSYAEAASIEADMNRSEKKASKELEKKGFELFQSQVVIPLNELLTNRITKATQLFDELRSRLFVENREPNPNMAQEEGDEQPELLEKLTLLKWIFETREVFHRASYDILSDRNERYREMVMTPYRLAGNEEKLAHASAFFAEDASKRAAAFADEVLQRTSEFRDVVEENVVRGVEVQLSAFWDIAPLFNRARGGAIASLADFRIQIPQAEIVENPSYIEHPLQYFYSLLLHAEKSTYQFIESQTNLFCLLHEVNEAVLMARVRVMEEQGQQSGRSKEQVEAFRRDEGQRLTDDLKEKVRVVQEQWRTAFGDRVELVKERVGEWLLETGGWDEALEDRGVGSL
ncbi:hypothetical protein BD289DRAFT_359030 [Coniella lustricola]|uniref:Uncharacterized protein n=1 Tax=Coniella lustricola TaxID=2025994 RepID=A0A2T3AM80_9PEZI|nr:hypothetical protein BD289DRAFT_359030 [Coniella lustricola]